MNESKRKRLEAKGWSIGDTQAFLDLADEEIALIGMKLPLGRELKERRKRKRLSQAEFARRSSPSQSKSRAS